MQSFFVSISFLDLHTTTNLIATVKIRAKNRRLDATSCCCCCSRKLKHFRLTQSSIYFCSMATKFLLLDAFRSAWQWQWRFHASMTTNSSSNWLHGNFCCKNRRCIDQIHSFPAHLQLTQSYAHYYHYADNQVSFLDHVRISHSQCVARKKSLVTFTKSEAKEMPRKIFILNVSSEVSSVRCDFEQHQLLNFTKLINQFLVVQQQNLTGQMFSIKSLWSARPRAHSVINFISSFFSYAVRNRETIPSFVFPLENVKNWREIINTE